MVSTTHWARSPRTSEPRPGTKHEASRGLDSGAKGCPVSPEELAKPNLHPRRIYAHPPMQRSTFGPPGGAPNVTTGTARGGSARPLGRSTDCSVIKEWEARGDWLGGVFLTVTLRSPRLLTEVGFFWACPEEELDRGIYEGAPVSSSYSTS